MAGSERGIHSFTFYMEQGKGQCGIQRVGKKFSSFAFFDVLVITGERLVHFRTLAQ